MTRGLSLRTVEVVALLLPGLVMAAPIAGPCGLCGDGESCHMQQPVKPETDAHSCCAEPEEEAPPATTLGSSSCECGRETPPALTAETSPSVEPACAATSIRETVSPTIPVGTAFSRSTRLAAPPPAPPAYLIDCAFLT